MAVGSSNYPTSVDTVVELVEAANNAADTLNGGIDAIATSLTLNDASEFTNSGIVAIEAELLSYTGRSGNTLTGLTRGIESTAAASHSSGVDVRQVISAKSHNVLASAIIALETKLGAGNDIALAQLAPLTASKFLVSDGSGVIAASSLAPPTGLGTAGQALLSDGAGGTSWGNVSTGLVVGTTTVTGGTSGRVLYDNAGVVGEYATTGTGDVVRATSPTITTPNIAKLANLTTNGFVKTSGSDGTLSVDTSTYLTGNQSITLSGDATGSGTTSIPVTLANSGVTAGTYKSVTVDVKGRVTAGTNPTTLAGYGITDAQPLNSDLTAIAALTADGLLRKTSGTWGMDSSAYLTSVNLATNVTGTLPIANGGTGATTAAGALTSLGAYPASNPSGYTSNTGTVTSVAGTGSVNGITLTGTVTTSGNLTLGGTLSNVNLASQVTGTLPAANGGTGQTSYTDGQLLIGNTATGGLSKATLTAGSNISITNGNGSISIASTAAGVTDGDKGDITVSGSGATWTIDNDAVTYAKIQNVTDNRLLGRSAGTNGDVQEITVGTGLTLSSGQLRGGREVLTADRTYYVRTDGSDSNNGLTDSAGGAFLTIQKAVDVAGSIDPSIYDITIQVKPGTYAGFVRMVSMVMIKNLFIKGDTRVLAGMSYVDNSGSRVPVWRGTTNLGGYAGVGNVTITRTTTTRLTITASTTNPNFSGGGWAAGDKILVYSGHSANTFTEYTLSAVGATTLDISSGSFPAIADGYMVTFVPNVKVAPTTTPPTGTLGTFSAVNTLQAYIIGFEILPSSATGVFDCVAPQANAEINVHNCLLNLNGSTSSSGINGGNTKISNYATDSLPYPLTVVNGGWGLIMQQNGLSIVRYIRAAKLTYNCAGGYDRSYLDVLGSVGIKCGTAFLASRNAYLDARSTISLGHVTDDYDPNPKTINSTAGSADLSYILT